MEDAAEDFRRNSFRQETWEEVAANASCNGNGNGMTKEQQSRLKLARLIQKRGDFITTKEQIEMVDELESILSEYPRMAQEADDHGRLPLHVALENGLSLECIKILVKCFPESIVMLYQDPEHGLQSAIRCASTVAILEFLTDSAMRYLHSWLLQDDSWDAITSFFQLHYNMESVLQRLVNEFPEFLRQILPFDGKHDTRLALHYVVERKASEEVLRILIYGYPPALTTRSRELGETPLDVAIRVWHASPDILRLLATTKSVRLRSKCNGTLPLHEYLRNVNIHDLEVVQLLVELFPQSVTCRVRANVRKTFLASSYCCQSMTPLHVACSVARVAPVDPESFQIIRFLAERYPAALSLRDALGNTPAIYCACLTSPVREYDEGVLSLIKLLMEVSPESVRFPDSSGNTILHRYLLRDSLSDPFASPSLSVVGFLVDSFPDALKVRDNVRKRTPLDIACDSSLLDIIPFLLQKSPALLEIGLDTSLNNVCCRAGLPLRHDDKVRYLRILSSLIEASEKAATTPCDSDEQTPLHLLCRVGAEREFLQVIIDKFPSAASVRDNNGRIPLHSAIQGYPEEALYEYDAHLKTRYENVVRYLLELHPLGVHTTDDSGLTPLMLACQEDVSLDIIFQLVTVEPLSNRSFEWSQVPLVNKESPRPWDFLLSTIGQCFFGGNK